MTSAHPEPWFRAVSSDRLDEEALREKYIRPLIEQSADRFELWFMEQMRTEAIRVLPIGSCR